MLPKPQYYDVTADLRKYPEAVVIIAYSRRGVGKTYSALKGALEGGFPIVYIKEPLMMLISFAVLLIHLILLLISPLIGISALISCHVRSLMV